MSRSGRTNFIADIFARGLPVDLQAMLGLDVLSWTLLNVPLHVLGKQRGDELPPSIDAIAGPLVAKHEPDLAEVERRARWHYGLPGQEAARQRMATDLALSRGLLVPEVKHAVAVQFSLPCEDPAPDSLGEALTRLGFEQVIVLVGADAQTQSGRTAAMIVRTQVETQEDGLAVRIEDGQGEANHRRAHSTSRRLRAWLHRLLRTVELPRRLPCVVDLADP